MAQTETSPVVASPRTGRVADPCVMVIFGVSGDLTHRKLIPALYNLARQQLLSREFAIIGVGRTPMTTEEARKKYSDDFKHFIEGAIDPDLWGWMAPVRVRSAPAAAATGEGDESVGPSGSPA